MMHRLLAIAVLAILALALPVMSAAQDPIATAQAAEQQVQDAQWRANQANQAVRSARSTADAAYVQATAEAQAAAATAQWIATATPAAATAQAQATREALEVEATQQAISAEATTAAYYHQAIATAQAQALLATATQQAVWAEMDRLEIERGQALQPLYTVGPWLIAGALALAIGTILLQAARTAAKSEYHGDIIEGEYRLLPETAGLTEDGQPCILRPIPQGQSRRVRQEE